VEEIGRIYGYDRMPHTLMEDALPPQRRNVALDGEEKVRDVLVGAGLTEIITYSMIDIADDARIRADKVAPDRRLREGANPLTRTGHICVGRTAASSTSRALTASPTVAIFGEHVFIAAGRGLPAETRHLAHDDPTEPQDWQRRLTVELLRSEV
jgi:hypothetical protein